MNEIKIIQWGRENLPFDVLLKKTASEYPKPSDLDLPFPSPFSYDPTQSEIFLCGHLVILPHSSPKSLPLFLNFKLCFAPMPLHSTKFFWWKKTVGILLDKIRKKEKAQLDRRFKMWKIDYVQFGEYILGLFFSRSQLDTTPKSRFLGRERAILPLFSSLLYVCT